ncbi:hypothetical protein A2456_00670 [Candidatus Nomurabacteria bacterium RIFOXYC2_FULL_36_19]|uniref:Uncharacterized protein n=2 Tax=Candidatus Nomuraibacteriota TaxID=1752729 RepID=A0A1F6YSX6_9BACT|nr:MAG: hypothetical protein A2192_01245 [Candidatus Nomurabacteria bacterium RIFOXYA1_FULL_35_17]OGJ09473.1 MAG: hypothetical protein A2456_00670 [Candidatus Nomurabacteria bacterium RIFOXYC2_FULL_36_19]
MSFIFFSFSDTKAETDWAESVLSFVSLIFKYSAQSSGKETFCRSDEICASKGSWRIQGSGHFISRRFLEQ